MKLNILLLTIGSVLTQNGEDDGDSRIPNDDIFNGLKWPQDMSKYIERIVAQWVLNNPSQLPDNSKAFEALDNLYNIPEAPCNAKYWNLKLKGSTRGEGGSSTYTVNDKSIEVKRENFLGTCQPLTRNFDPNRLVFYFKDDKCKEFDKAACN